jgi:hypothetical protein
VEEGGGHVAPSASRARLSTWRPKRYSEKAKYRDSCHTRAAFVRTLGVDCRLGNWAFLRAFWGMNPRPARAGEDDRGPADPKPAPAPAWAGHPGPPGLDPRSPAATPRGRRRGERAGRGLDAGGAGGGAARGRGRCPVASALSPLFQVNSERNRGVTPPFLLLKTSSTPRCTLHCTTSYSDRA